MMQFKITDTPMIQQLQHALDSAPEGLPRAAALNAWCWEAWCYAPSLALQRVNEALQLAYDLLRSDNSAELVLADSLLCKAHLLIRMNRVHEINLETANTALIFSQRADVNGTLRYYWLEALRCAALNEERQALSILQSLLHEPTTMLHPLVLGRVQLSMGLLLMRMGEGQAAISHLEAAANTFSDAHHPLLHGQALAAWTNALLLHDHPRTVIDLANSALPLQRHQLDWYSQVITLQCVIRAYLHLEDVASARQHLNGYAMISHHIESILGPHYQLMLQAKVEHKDGNLQQADAYITSALNLRSNIISPYEAIKLYETAAMIYEARGKYEQALKYEREAARIRRERLNKARQDVARAVRLPSPTNIFNHPTPQQQSTDNQLRAQLEELSRLLDMFSEVTSSPNVSGVASLSLDAAMRFSNADAGFFAVLYDDTWRISSVMGNYESLRIVVSGTLQRELKTRRVLVLPEGQVHVEGLPICPTSKVRILVPLYVANRLVGLLNLETAKPQRFNASVYRLMKRLQPLVTVALDNALRHERLAQQNQALSALLKQLESLKNDMIHLASHDLKQPLTRLRLYLSILQREVERQLTGKQKDYFNTISEALSRMEHLINHLDRRIICSEQVELTSSQAASQQ
jgi:tetratricopeptide (TPR) repeat protein